MSSVEEIQRLAAKVRTRIKEIDTEQAKRLIEKGAVLIDVREEKEFKAGHIFGSVLISLGVLENRVAQAVPDKSAAIVCYCAVGHRSAIAADTLQTLGYANVVSLAGGFRAWLSTGSDRKSA